MWNPKACYCFTRVCSAANQSDTQWHMTQIHSCIFSPGRQIRCRKKHISQCSEWVGWKLGLGSRILTTQDAAYHSKTVAWSWRLLVATLVNLCTQVSASRSGTLYCSLHIHSHIHRNQMVEPKSGTTLYQMYSVEEGMDSHGVLLRSADIVVGRDACGNLSDVRIAALN